MIVEDIHIFSTDFGIVHAGPMFRDAVMQLQPDLALNKRTNRYKRAKSEADKLSQCVNTLAGLYWVAGQDFHSTP